MKKVSLVLSISLSLIIGMFSQGWVQTGDLPHVSRYDDIYFVNDSVGWVVGSGGNIYKTTNAGTDWRQVFDSDQYMRSIEFIDDSVGFAGSLEEGFWRTKDGGETWSDITDSLPTPIDGMCGLSHFGDHVFGVGIYNDPAFFISSYDRGLTWSYKDMSEYASALVECHFVSELKGFIGGSRFGEGAVLFKTEDGGETWEQVSFNPGGFNFFWKIFFVDETVAYSSIESIQGAFLFARTNDGGDTWTVMEGQADGQVDIQGIGFDSPLHGWISPRTDSILETFDGGQSWYQTENLMNINRMFQAPGGRLFASGSQVYYYDNATSIKDHPTGVIPHRLNVNPNPFSEMLQVRIQMESRSDAKVMLSSFDGRFLHTIFDGSLNKGTYDYTVSAEVLHNLSDQLYLVILATDDGFHTSTILKSSK